MGALPEGTAKWGERALLGWMALIRRRPLLVVLLSLALAAAGLAVSVRHLTINTSLTELLSPDLPFQRNALEIEAAFPQLEEALTVVVDAESPEAAETAAARISSELRAQPSLITGVFYPEGEAFFRQNGLLFLQLPELQALADRLAEMQPLLVQLRDDPTFRGLDAALAPLLQDPGHEAAAALVPALAALAERAEAAAEGPPRRLSWQVLAGAEDAEGDSGPAPAGGRVFLSVQPALSYDALVPGAEAIAAVDRAASGLAGPEYGGVRVRVTGIAAMRGDELKSLEESMGLVGLVSLVLVIVLLTFGLRSVRLIAATVAALFVGLLTTAGFATLAVGQLSVISVAFAVLFIGLSVDFGIHFALRYREQVEAGAAPSAALDGAAAGVGGALCLAALCAAIGFFSFLPTSYRGLAELGLISGVGMFIALFCNLTLLPALLALFPLRPRTTAQPVREDGAAPEEAPGARPARWPRAVLAAALLLALGAAAALPFARFDDDPMNLRDPDSSSVATLRDLIDDPSLTPYTATLLAENLEAANAIAARFAALPEVSRAETLLSFVPGDQDEKILVIEDMSFFLAPLLLPAEPAPPPDAAAREAALEGLARTAAALAEAAPDAGLAQVARRLAAALAPLEGDPAAQAALETAVFAWLPKLTGDLGQALLAEPFGLEDLPADLRARWLAPDGRALVEAQPAEDLRDPAARLRFVRAVQQVAPEVSGGAITMTEGGRAVIRAYQQAAVLAILAISALLVLLLRRLSAVLLVLAPLVLAALLTVAATVVLDLPFNFANVIVLPLLFGLGVAGSLHMVLRARQAAPGGLLASCTPRAVLFSALTTVGSFGALALSSHRGTASMGLLLTIAIALTLVCTLVVLPALLSWHRGRRGEV